jgi:hypothetical protein
MTNAPGWVKLSEASKHMGIGRRHNALRRLQRLEAATGQVILRRVGDRWEVSKEGFRRAMSDQPERRMDDLEAGLLETNERLDALRNVGAKFRKATRDRFEEHERKIEANHKLSVALAESQLVHGTARNGPQRPADNKRG